MRFKKKHKGPPKADEIQQAERILFQFVQNESFLKILNFAKLSFSVEEDGW